MDFSLTDEDLFKRMVKPGIDNPWYDYIPYPKRPRLAWPKNSSSPWWSRNVKRYRAG